MNLPPAPSNPELNKDEASCRLEFLKWEALVLDRETVEKVSKLARLKLSEDEVAAFAQQLSSVLENFEQIAQVDTNGIRPLVTPTDMSVSFRPDEAVLETNETENEKLLENAPEKSGRLFKVPPVV